MAFFPKNLKIVQLSEKYPRNRSRIEQQSSTIIFWLAQSQNGKLLCHVSEGRDDITSHMTSNWASVLESTIESTYAPDYDYDINLDMTTQDSTASIKEVVNKTFSTLANELNTTITFLLLIFRGLLSYVFIPIVQRDLYDFRIVVWNKSRGRKQEN